MAYEIKPISASEFVTSKTKLPRFQRKQTWGPKDNFKLCISVFKKYPIGVVIINQRKKEDYLLDGRQRLNALRLMYSNPVEIYNWAKSYIGIKPNWSEEQIREGFWVKIDEYMRSGAEDNSTATSSDLSANNDEEEVGSSQTVVDDDFSFDENEQKENLALLLDIILLMHKDKWKTIFDFRKYIDKLKYYKSEIFSPEKLVELICDYLKELDEQPCCKDSFISYLNDNCQTIPNKEKQLSKHIETHWENIEKSFAVIQQLREVMRKATVGMIQITQGTDLDAQNIFSLINKGGTQLTAGELLSAKPYWNEKVSVYTEETKEKVVAVYKQLGITVPDDIVRWDLCAVLLDRLQKSDKFVFSYVKKPDSNKKSEKEKYEKALLVQRTLGFKLFAAILVGGVSSARISSIEKLSGFDWDSQFEKLVEELRDLCEYIGEHPYFKSMSRWKQNIMSLTSNTIALEFLAMVYKKWGEIGKPTTDKTVYRELRNQSVMLFDRLVYEYTSRLWSGSSDTRLERDLNKKEERMSLIKFEEWTEKITNLCNGFAATGTPVTQDLASPVLYHSMFLSGLKPIDPSTEQYHVDHIIPQDKFRNNKVVNSGLCDSLCNLEILSSSANEKKKNKALKEIHDEDVVAEIVHASGIKEDEFKKYSDITNFELLRKDRRQKFLTIFKEKRSSLFANN